MPFPQEQVAWLLANQAKISRYLFIPQLVAALLFLGFAYVTGKTPAHLLLQGERTRGKIVALVPVQMNGQNRNGSSFSRTIYEPLVEFKREEDFVRFQEWKGSESRAGVGSSVPILYDQRDPSFAMMDRGLANWLPWAPCFAIGFVLAFASLRSLFVFLRSGQT